MANSVTSNPVAKYNKLSEKLRQVTPDELQCSMFCGGKKCKYESATCWDAKETAINGLYSHWITDEILACARPNTANIDKYNIIEQFQNHGIKSIFNLQSRGEHNSCTAQLHKSGFSYNPQVFMKQNIFFYNFAIKDYGVASPDFLLDMVKVMAFALNEGRVAVHCHAGLGRTGVLIASFLIYSLRVRANEVIRYVRAKRPNSIQTRGQIQCVQQFARHILPNFITFSIGIEDQFTLDEFLQRQAKILHGYEARLFKSVPKVIFVIGRRLLQLCCHKNGGDFSLTADDEMDTTASSGTSAADAIENRKTGLIRQKAMSSSFDEAGITWPEADDPDMEIDDSVSLSELSDENVNNNLGSCFAQLQVDDVIKHRIISSDVRVTLSCEDIVRTFINCHLVVRTDLKRYQQDLNKQSISWELLACENDAQLLIILFCSWFQQLKEPIISGKDRKSLDSHNITLDNVWSIFKGLTPGVRGAVNYLVRLVNQFHPLKEDSRASLARHFAFLLSTVANDTATEKLCLTLLTSLQNGIEDKFDVQPTNIR